MDNQSPSNFRISGEVSPFSGAARGTDGTFFVVSRYGGLCDVPTLDNQIMKIDVNGNLIWTKTEDDLGTPFLAPYRTANNGGVWGAGDGELIELDNNGNIAQNVSVNVDNITSYDYDLSTGDFIVFGGNSTSKKLLYLENTGNNYEIMMSGSAARQVEFLDNNTIAVLDNDNLKLYDNQLNLTASLNNFIQFIYAFCKAK